MVDVPSHSHRGYVRLQVRSLGRRGNKDPLASESQRCPEYPRLMDGDHEADRFATGQRLTLWCRTQLPLAPSQEASQG